ncbi:hypothetical protein [Argonema antarcticum]|uniref:hypothetical protein n=1 Tax=Argonema antarcticum TaxID=2942763 RepID=UPI002011516F|nr:hypothetical protein [Argonema antarcticum]MCL1474449.1 hypothetical protein [Argonema antarcticum A004/B2]
MRKLKTTQREISTQPLGQVVQFPQRQTAWTSKKASQKTLGLPVWAVFSLCSVGFGIGFVGISFLLSNKKDYHPIKDSESRTRVSDSFYRTASLPSDDVSSVRENDFSNVLAPEIPAQKPTVPPLQSERINKDVQKKQVQLPRVSVALSKLPSIPKIPSGLRPKISMPMPPKLSAIPPGPRITVPNPSNAIGDAIHSVPAIPKMQLKVNTEALEHTRSNAMALSQKAVVIAVAATPKIARSIDATAAVVASRAGDAASHTVSAVDTLAQKGTQAVQAVQNSGTATPQIDGGDRGDSGNDGGGAGGEAGASSGGGLPDGAKGLGGGKYQLPDGTLVQQVDCETGQPIAR